MLSPQVSSYFTPRANLCAGSSIWVPIVQPWQRSASSAEPLCLRGSLARSAGLRRPQPCVPSRSATQRFVFRPQSSALRNPAVRPYGFLGHTYPQSAQPPPAYCQAKGRGTTCRLCRCVGSARAEPEVSARWPKAGATMAREHAGRPRKWRRRMRARPLTPSRVTPAQK